MILTLDGGALIYRSFFIHYLLSQTYQSGSLRNWGSEVATLAPTERFITIAAGKTLVRW